MILAALLAAVWLTGTEGPSAVVDSANLVGRVVASRFDGTNDYTTVYFTHDLDRAPSAAVCYVAKGATNAVYGVWQGGWTNKFDIGGKTYTPDDYVQDGLIAMWDGEWNAGRGVHDATATTWKNLVGSLDVTCTGVTVGDKYLYFPKTGSQGTASFSSLTPYGCLEIALTKSQAGDHMNIISVGAQYSGWGMSDNYGKITDTNDGKASPYVTMTYGINLNPTTITLNFLNLTAQCGDIAKNGVFGSEGTLNAGGRYNGGTDCININGGRSAEKRMYCIRMYSRNLTAAEVAANYNVDYIRFVLGTGSDWTDCRVLVTRRPVALRSAQARPDLRFAFGNADTRTPFAVKGITLTVNSNAVHMVDGILTKKGL